MEFRFDRRHGESPWGSCQPRFERLVTDGAGGYFLVGKLTTGEPISVQLTPATIEPPPSPNGD